MKRGNLWSFQEKLLMSTPSFLDGIISGMELNIDEIERSSSELETLIAHYTEAKNGKDVCSPECFVDALYPQEFSFHIT